MITICTIALYGFMSFGPPTKEYYITSSEAACERIKQKRGASWAVSDTTEQNSLTYKRVCGVNGADCSVIK